MPTPRTRFWKAIAVRDWGEGPEPGPWRDSQTDPPPAPPTEVFWLEQPAGMPDALFQSRVSLGAEPSFRAPQNP